MAVSAKPAKRAAAKVKRSSRTKAAAPPEAPPIALTAEQAAAALVLLYDAPFGGQPAGRRFRMSDASLRDLAARRFLGLSFVDEVAMHLASRGFDLVRMEGYVVVQQTRLHEGLRRAPANLREAAREAAAAGAAEITQPTTNADDDE
jgi:hypothetical protein